MEDEYNWEKEINERGKDDWSDWNAESQAEVFKDIWDEAELRDSAGNTLRRSNGCFYDADGRNTFGHYEIRGKDYTAIANKAVEKIRSG